VCGKPGLDIICKSLPALRKLKNIAFCVVNGENANMHGLSPENAELIFTHGADVITLGNHTWSQRSIIPYLDDCRYILRPGNFAPQVPGRGWGVFDSPLGDVFVMNLIGRLGVDNMTDSPFLALDRALATADARRSKIVLLDFHAEATSEKLAMRYYADGSLAAGIQDNSPPRVTCMWGTHTHVQTSDAEVSRRGMGYITDLGMCGAIDSILGVNPQTSVDHFLGNPRLRYEATDGDAKLEGAIFEVDADTGMCLGVEPVRIT
jgi:metallophosphoesterase (TIGR00282 family)